MASIRLAGPDDLPTLAPLLAGFRDFWGRAEPTDEAIERGLTTLLADPDTEFLLAEPDLGFAALRYRFVVWTDSPECELEDLFVRDSERGSGLGRALTEAAVERARERGCRRMNISANDANEPAIALYRSLGLLGLARPAGRPQPEPAPRPLARTRLPPPWTRRCRSKRPRRRSPRGWGAPACGCAATPAR